MKDLTANKGSGPDGIHVNVLRLYQHFQNHCVKYSMTPYILAYYHRTGKTEIEHHYTKRALDSYAAIAAQ